MREAQKLLVAYVQNAIKNAILCDYEYIIDERKGGGGGGGRVKPHSPPTPDPPLLIQIKRRPLFAAAT